MVLILCYWQKQILTDKAFWRQVDHKKKLQETFLLQVDMPTPSKHTHMINLRSNNLMNVIKQEAQTREDKKSKEKIDYDGKVSGPLRK